MCRACSVLSAVILLTACGGGGKSGGPSSMAGVTLVSASPPVVVRAAPGSPIDAIDCHPLETGVSPVARGREPQLPAGDRDSRRVNLAAADIPARVPIRITEKGWPTGSDRPEERQTELLEAVVRGVHERRGELNIASYVYVDLRDAARRVARLAHQHRGAPPHHRAAEQGAAVERKAEKGTGKQVGLSLVEQVGQRVMQPDQTAFVLSFSRRGLADTIESLTSSRPELRQLWCRHPQAIGTEPAHGMFPMRTPRRPLWGAPKLVGRQANATAHQSLL
jgi:hypothetical protein